MARLNSGSVSWQLAVRRLQLSSGTAARMVNGIAVAVAGAIALQMLFAGVEGDYTKRDRQRREPGPVDRGLRRERHLAGPGQRATRPDQGRGGGPRPSPLTWSATGPTTRTPNWKSPSAAAPNCRSVARPTGRCRDGDIYKTLGGGTDADVQTAQTAKAGRIYFLDPSYDSSPPTRWPGRCPRAFEADGGTPRGPDRLRPRRLLITLGALLANSRA
ncbi:hypothetical protein ACRAWF_06060 [Streptomyces sp. L7]